MAGTRSSSGPPERMRARISVDETSGVSASIRKMRGGPLSAACGVVRGVPADAGVKRSAIDANDSGARAAERPAAAQPGAYCPLPEPGQRPICLEPAQAHYADFFAAVERGRVTAADTAPVEADLDGRAGRERAYLALS